MNFKFTLIKTIASIIIGLITNFFIFSSFEGGCRGIYCYFPYFISYKFLWIFVMIIIYVVWSFFEKNEKKKRKK